MRNKNSTTDPKTTTPDYGSFNSYKLTDEQIKQAIQHFEWDFLNDSDDGKAGVFLALLRSFTYTTDNGERESMLVAAEEVLMPVVSACSQVMTSIAIRAHRQLIRSSAEN